MAVFCEWFILDVVMRKYVESLNAYTVVSLAVSVCGMLAFNYFKLRKSKKEQTGVEEKPSQDFHSQVNDQHPTSESPALGLYPSNKKRQLAINVDDDESAPLLLWTWNSLPDEDAWLNWKCA